MSLDASGDAVLARAEPVAPPQRLIGVPGWRTLAKVLISIGLLYWIITHVEGSEPLQLLSGAWWAVFAAWLMQSTLPVVQAERWRAIAATLGTRIPVLGAIKNVYIGQFFNQVLPSAIGGDAVRLWKAARFMPVSTALSSIALDRVVALIAIPIILAVGSGMLLHIVPPGPLRLSLLATIAAAGTALMLFLWADRIPLPQRLLQLRIVEVLRATPLAARRLFLDPVCLVRALGLSIVIHVGVGTSLWLLAKGHGVDAPLAAFVLLAPMVTLVTTIPISVAGWGVREGAMVTALGLIGVPAATALTISIQFGLIMLIVGLPGGLLTLLDSPAATVPADQSRA